jgi:hypothetical protein
MIIPTILLLGALLTDVNAIPPELQSFLQERIEFSQKDIQALEQGKAVTKLLDTGKKPEVAVFGIMHLDVPVDFFVDRYRDIERFMRTTQVVEIAKFSSPPQVNDLRGLTLEPDELLAIKECKVGKCHMKLPASVIERLRREIDWSKPDCEERATSMVRDLLLDYVKAYHSGGSAAMGQYDDQKYPLRLADEFHELLQESDYLYEYVPEFYQYLEAYPQSELSGVEDFIYWSKKKYDKLRPLVSINHVTIYERPQGKGNSLIASKQIYANHYFEASFELTALVEASAVADSTGFYLVYFNRSRFDTLRKDGPPGIKGKIKGEVHKKVEQEMNATKAEIEALYQKANLPSNRPGD